MNRSHRSVLGTTVTQTDLLFEMILLPTPLLSGNTDAFFYLCVYRDATFLLELKTTGSSWNCYLGGKLAHNYFSYPDRSLPQPFVTSVGRQV